MSNIRTVGTDLRVLINSFSCHVSKTQRATINISGQVERIGVSCHFTFQLGPKKTRLTFKDAWIRDQSHPQEVAFAVKCALADFIRKTDVVPDAYREQLVQLVLRHHLQDKEQR
ncbi:hypothetical protein BcepSauron_233 [Burkholderia phage BcepSauron]|uniref:Uncharacterized protein n=2 Tax=Sarumanvirus TaxID=2843450 RepID=A0A482MN61_9CAUD|nr:hypothetical protein H1O16_gp231 [Burkholderia phage BcepSaruman]YP_009904611.1 hypothetical protein H1O17_gp233 [Burkholderia phage BcepSauron]QBQ74613.1 hypothetical protein BcepSauron_233 [Burkholderia phage BcepSauron]QBX06644.1 hypothetical protein BcepSaruman_231 [Burkholderia phage BcepSaruman]